MSRSLARCLVLAACWMPCGPLRQAMAAAPAAVVCPAKASLRNRLAAKEVRRYVYPRGGWLWPRAEG